MAPKKGEAMGKRVVVNKGAWTAEEDQRLSNYIQRHGAKQWKTASIKAGLNRCGKSCRLRWLNYLRPNIIRGNISGEEEDLIVRLHKLLGNRWSLIAGRLPGRTDNEIKNYWNSHLRKRVNQEVRNTEFSAPPSATTIQPVATSEDITEETVISEDSEICIDFSDLFDLSLMNHVALDWVNEFLETDVNVHEIT